MSARPDYGKEPPEYAVTIIDVLSRLTEEELGWVTDMQTGVSARCKFAPTVADIMELVKERHGKRDQFKAAPTGYRRFEKEPDPVQPPAEVRREQVKALLGYDPLAPAKRTVREELVPPSTDDLEQIKAKAKLPQPSKSDMTQSLREMLEKEGYL